VLEQNGYNQGFKGELRTLTIRTGITIVPQWSQGQGHPARHARPQPVRAAARALAPQAGRAEPIGAGGFDQLLGSRIDVASATSSRDGLSSVSLIALL
jgi:hypothetical protein